MYGGEIVQQAPPAELYDEPATPWVAEFVGDANLLEGDAGGATATTSLGQVPLRHDLHGPALVLLRPEELRLLAADGTAGRATSPAPSTGSTGTVELIEFYGHDTVYLVRPDEGHLVRVRAGSAPLFRRGDRVTISYTGAPAVAYQAEVPVRRPAVATTRPAPVPAGAAR
jgi:iron(III) transport system ATP-binding protein